MSPGRLYGSLDQQDHNPIMDSFPPQIIGSASANYARVSMLVIDEGTQVAAQAVLENLPSHQTLEEALKAKSHQIQSLMARNIINMTPGGILYPETGQTINRDGIDLTLWVILLRHVTTNAKSINKKWTEDPQIWQRKYWHDIQRLKRIRNKLAHNAKAELEEDSFRKIWQEAEEVLLRLNVPASTINNYLERDIDPERARKVVQGLKDQFLNDLSALLIQSKSANRKLKIMLCVIAVVIIILVTVSVVVPFFVLKQWTSCANNIQYVHTDYAMAGYITRKGWGARKPTGPMDHLHLPVEYVIISHTAQVTTPCATTDDCCATVKEIQEVSMDHSGFSDIAYTYVIGDSGIIFIGRGPDYKPATAFGWNYRSVSIGFIGLFRRKPPSDEAIDALATYLDVLVETNIIVSNYTLYGMCQVRETFPYSPGAAFLKVLKDEFPHWGNKNIDWCDTKKSVPGSYVT